jgi:hypothetical protein
MKLNNIIIFIFIKWKINVQLKSKWMQYLLNHIIMMKSIYIKQAIMSRIKNIRNRLHKINLLCVSQIQITSHRL